MAAPGDEPALTIPRAAQGTSRHRPAESLPPEHSTRPRRGKKLRCGYGGGGRGGPVEPAPDLQRKSQRKGVSGRAGTGWPRGRKGLFLGEEE